MTQDSSGGGDGRGIDPSLGVLAGEAAGQKVPADRYRRGTSEGAAPLDLRDRPPEAHDQGGGYYGRPVLKEPVWMWAVPAYFYVGGLGGASAVLGAAAQLTGGPRRLVERCRWTTTAAVVVSTGLLIFDLGRKERFLNMLRVFRRTSPMSVGSWVLAASGGAASSAAVLSGTDGLLGALGDVSGAGAGVLGMPLAGYTAVLLSNSAVPAWREARRSLPFLFVSSAMNAAASVLEMMDLDEDEARVVQRFGTFGRAAELVAGVLVEREVAGKELTALAYKEGVAGSLWRGGEALAAASLGVGMLPSRTRLKRLGSGLTGSAAAAASKFAVFYAGKASTRDPRTTFEAQKRSASPAPDRTGFASQT
jgi:formate-dependent nitrite reductase membrane component NrfD